MMNIQEACIAFRILLEEQQARIANMDAEKVDFSTKKVVTIGVIDGDGIGPIITKQASRVLEKLLAEGHFSGVVLDVMDPEPLPESSPLWSCERVLLTPHISGIGFDHEPATERFIWDLCRENLRRYAAGDPLAHVVDVAAGY